MPTPAEQKALLFLGAVALLGGAVRLIGGEADGPDPTAAERAALGAQVAAVDSAAAARRAERIAGKEGKPARSGSRRKGGKSAKAGKAGDPEAPGASEPPGSLRSPRGKVDVDRATLEELDALPGVGPALAERIIADRRAHGSFGSLEALDAVSGVGPTLIKRLSPHVTFSGPRRHSTATGSAGGAPARGRVVGLIGGRP